MTEPDPDVDADVARLTSSPLALEGALVGAIVLLLAWPIARLLRRRRVRGSS